MKEQAIQKINKIGKVSNVIALVCKIFVIIGMVLTLAGAIICFVIPDSLVSFTIHPEVEITVNYANIGVLPTEDDKVALEQSLMLEFEANEKAGFTDVVIEDTRIKFFSEDAGSTFTMHDLAWMMVMILGMLLMTLITLIFIGKLCKAFRDCASPFEENVISKMQNLAYALIPWTIVSVVIDSVMESITSNQLSVMFSIDLGVVLVVLLVLVLVYIFKYGAVLQQESDETL